MNWDSARKDALSRDGGKCRHCLRPATDVHHRKPKGIGGTGDVTREYGMANLVSLCRSCHNWIHAHPAESYKMGWLVHSWENPEDIPVQVKEKYVF